MANHQAKPCQLIEGESKHPIQIHFPKEQLVYIQGSTSLKRSFILLDFLTKKNFELNESEDGSLYFTSDASGLVILERMLYFAQIGLYNIEQWYDALQSKKKQDGIDRTAPATFVALSDPELNLIQKLYTRNLLGTGSKSYARDELSLLSQLERNIQTAMDSLNSSLNQKTDSFFVRFENNEIDYL